MITAGIDMGSRSIKVVLVEERLGITMTEIVKGGQA